MTADASAAWADPSAHFINIPAELRQHDQWVCWRREERLGQITKVPYSALTRKHASSTNPNTWASFDEVVNTYRARMSLYHGIGFVLSPDDDYVGVDLDHCIENEVIADWALPFLWRLHSYAEISPSGSGLRIFVKGVLPKGGRKAGPIEMYSEGRYLTMTGWIVRPQSEPDAVPIIQERTAELAAIHEEVFGKPEPERPAPLPFRGPVRADDHELLERMFAAANGPRIRSLYYGLATHHASESEADEALISHLSFWTANDPQRMDGLFRQSARMRDKWDEIHAGDGRTYGQMTIMKVLRQQAVAQPATDQKTRRRIGGGIPA